MDVTTYNLLIYKFDQAITFLTLSVVLGSTSRLFFTAGSPYLSMIICAVLGYMRLQLFSSITIDDNDVDDIYHSSSLTYQICVFCLCGASAPFTLKDFVYIIMWLVCCITLLFTAFTTGSREKVKSFIIA